MGVFIPNESDVDYIRPHLQFSVFLNIFIMNCSCLTMLAIHHIAQCESSKPSVNRKTTDFCLLSGLDLVDSKYLDTKGDTGPSHSEEDLEL